MVIGTIVETLEKGEIMNDSLQEMEPEEFLMSLDFKVVDEIVEVKTGCTHQCYFCGVACSNSNKIHPHIPHIHTFFRATHVRRYKWMEK